MNKTTKIRWRDLDKFTSPGEIASFLSRRGIRGERGNHRECPLAKATGFSVLETERVSTRYPSMVRSLTEAEKNFVSKFDSGDYPGLED